MEAQGVPSQAEPPQQGTPQQQGASPQQGPAQQGPYQQSPPPQGQYPQGSPPQGPYPQGPPPQGQGQQGPPPQGWVQAPPGGGPTPAGGSAEEGRWPIRHTARTLTLPGRTLQINTGLGFDAFESVDDLFVSAGTALAYGVVDQVELQAGFLSLLLAPEVEYANPWAGALFAFNRGAFQAGGFVRLYAPVRENTGFTVDFGIPLEVGSRVFRFETGFILSITPPYTITGIEGSEFETDLYTVQSVPMRFSFQFAEMVFMRINTGWAMADGEPETTTIPWGADMGFTIRGTQGPLADLIFGFSFPAFIVPDADEIGYTERWRVGLSANFFVFL